MIYTSRSHTPLQTVTVYLARMVRDFVIDVAILWAAQVVAISLRKQLPFGGSVDTHYGWGGAEVYLLCVASLFITYALRLIFERPSVDRSAWRLLAPLLGVIMSAGVITYLHSYQSRVETVYFVVLGLLLTILIVPRPDTARETGDLAFHLKRLWANRSLLRIWVQFNVQSRYAQAILGILWIILLPLSQALIMTAVFSSIIRISAGNVPFIAFFLAGLVPWGLFSQAISAGMRSILGAMGLITQINFPREIIVLSALGEALVDTFFMFIAMLIINAVVGVWPNANYGWLVVLLLIQLAMMAGLMCLVSWLSVIVRDVPQLVSVILQVLFYLCPIIYPAAVVPARFRFLLVLNPIATLIEGYRDIIVYNRVPGFDTLVYPMALAVGFLVFGYRIFKAHEDTFADMV